MDDRRYFDNKPQRPSPIPSSAVMALAEVTIAPGIAITPNATAPTAPPLAAMFSIGNCSVGFLGVCEPNVSYCGANGDRATGVGGDERTSASIIESTSMDCDDVTLDVVSTRLSVASIIESSSRGELGTLVESRFEFSCGFSIGDSPAEVDTRSSLCSAESCGLAGVENGCAAGGDCR